MSRSIHRHILGLLLLQPRVRTNIHTGTHGHAELRAHVAFTRCPPSPGLICGEWDPDLEVCGPQAHLTSSYRLQSRIGDTFPCLYDSFTQVTDNVLRITQNLN